MRPFCVERNKMNMPERLNFLIGRPCFRKGASLNFNIMQSPTASDWAAARGEKWLAQLGGIEAMNAPVDVPLIRALNQTVPQRRVRQIARLAAAGRLRRHRDARLARQVPNRRRTTAGGGRDL